MKLIYTLLASMMLLGIAGCEDDDGPLEEAAEEVEEGVEDAGDEIEDATD